MPSLFSPGGKRIDSGAQTRAWRGPTISGQRVTTLDLYVPERHVAEVVWEISLPPGIHQLELRVLGTKDRRSTDTRVDLDAILVQRPAASP